MKGKLIKRNESYMLYVDSIPYACSKVGVLLKNLSYQNCDEIFGVVDVEKLADDYSKHLECLPFERDSYKAGFNKAMELKKDKVFTIDDIDKAIEWATVNGRKGDITHYDIDNFIQSLQQPTEIEVEIETETKVWEFISNGEFESFEIIPKLDSNGCLILKTI
jgi:hypothetical protein